MEKLTHQEEEIMLVIWKKKRGIIKDFLEQLPEPQPPYTTVASIVKNLSQIFFQEFLFVGEECDHFFIGIWKIAFYDSR